jgi:hypothetical protein
MALNLLSANRTSKGVLLLAFLMIFTIVLAFINFGIDEVANPRLRKEPKTKLAKIEKLDQTREGAAEHDHGLHDRPFASPSLRSGLRLTQGDNCPRREQYNMTMVCAVYCRARFKKSQSCLIMFA